VTAATASCCGQPAAGRGVAIKLREIIRVVEGGSDLDDDETTSLQQMLAFAEAAA
jgi:hypothetical protein